MQKLIDKFSGIVKGAISKFDRIAFKGLILPLMSYTEVMPFCRPRSILNKDYKQWMLKQTAGLIKNAEQHRRQKEFSNDDAYQKLTCYLNHIKILIFFRMRTNILFVASK